MSTRVIAIDWSGDKKRARSRICVAEVVDGILQPPELGRDRDEVCKYLLEGAERPQHDLIVGLDFAFSCPLWFVHKHQCTSIREFWEVVARTGEQWLSHCESPFWGRAACRKPTGVELFRETEKTLPTVNGIEAKSVFQIGGAGAVGTGSVRGMPFLSQLRQSFSIWPFDPPKRHCIVEIYPRLLTGGVNKTSVTERRRRLQELLSESCLTLAEDMVERAASSEDAFDAAASALVMWKHRKELRALEQIEKEPYNLEGAIWFPDAACPNSKMQLASTRQSGTDSIVTLADIQLAQSRLRGVATRTPLIPYHHSPERQLWLKPESLQPIGSFKLRGAYNKIASLSEEERKRGVISYSSGNHAQGVAYAARAMGVRAVIVMPRNAPQIKLDGTAALGAEIVLVGPASSERHARAEELAKEHGYVIVPPYNDEQIIAGQGTIGLEIAEDLPEVETVFVPIGGGGLISGVATALKLSRPGVKVIGVEPELAADAQASFRAGRIVEFSGEQVSRTLADGLRTQSVGEINFAHIRRHVDDVVTVSEEEILKAMRLMALHAKLVAEPSGAVTFAAFLFHAEQLPRTRLNVAIISGGNVEPQVLARVLSDVAL